MMVVCGVVTCTCLVRGKGGVYDGVYNVNMVVDAADRGAAPRLNDGLYSVARGAAPRLNDGLDTFLAPHVPCHITQMLWHTVGASGIVCVRI
jgi:hypothetical protein